MSLVVCGTEAMQDKLELYIAAADGDVELGTAAWLEYYTKAKTDAGSHRVLYILGCTSLYSLLSLYGRSSIACLVISVSVM